MTLVDKVRAIVKGKDTYEKLWDKRNSLSRALSSLNSSENDELKRKKIYAEMADVALQQEDYKHAESYAFTSGDDTMERKVCAAIASQCERHGNYTYGAEIAIKGGLIDRAKALYEKEYRRTIYDFGVETEPDYGDTLGIFKHRAILMETPSYHGCEEQARYRCEILARICEKAAEIGGDLWLLRAEDLYRALGDEYVKSFQKRTGKPLDRNEIRKPQWEEIRKEQERKNRAELEDEREDKKAKAREKKTIDTLVIAGSITSFCGGAALGYGDGIVDDCGAGVVFVSLPALMIAGMGMGGIEDPMATTSFGGLLAGIGYGLGRLAKCIGG